MLRHDAHAKELQQLLPQQPVWLQKASNTSHWQPATVISTPGESTPRSYVASTQDGAKYQTESVDVAVQRIIPDEKLKVPPKGIQCEYRCTQNTGTSAKQK